MSTTNPVTRILPTSGNQSILAAGSRADALAVGQLGIFNYHTGLSIDGSVAADSKDIFFAVGVDNGLGALGDIRRSAGQVLQVRNTFASTFKGYVPSVPKIIDISGFSVKCETDYIIKLHLHNGDVIYRYGYNAFVKSFSYKSGCCSDQCVPCGEGSCSEVVQALVAQINADTDKLATATYFANMINATVTAGASATASITITVGTSIFTVPVTSGNTATQVAAAIVTSINGTTGSTYRATNTGAILSIYPKATLNVPTGTFALTNANGTSVTVGTIVASAKTVVADPVAFAVANPGVCLGIRITTSPLAIRTYCNVNLKYTKFRETNLSVVLKAGFDCNGDTVTVQEMQIAEGLAYDLKQEESDTNLSNSPYRVSALNGVAKDAPTSLVNTSVNYDQFILAHNQESVGGWLEYMNNLRTIIAIPCGDATTLTSVVTALDLIFTQFGAMANDVAANGDCTNVRTGALTYATDGIESLTT